jgi:hypothetical protein
VLVDIDVWAGDIYAGTLPPICVFTGEPTRGMHTVRYSTFPRWVWALLFAGVLPFIVGVILTRRTVTGTLPMCAKALKRFVVLRIVTLVVIVLVPAALFIAAWLVSGSSNSTNAAPLLVLAGLIDIVVGAVGLTLWAGSITVAGAIDDRPGWGRWVRLKGVNPTFAAAAQRLYASRMPQWQIGTVPTGFAAISLPDGYAPPRGPFGWTPPQWGGAPFAGTGMPPSPPPY